MENIRAWNATHGKQGTVRRTKVAAVNYFYAIRVGLCRCIFSQKCTNSHNQGVTGRNRCTLVCLCKCKFLFWAVGCGCARPKIIAKTSEPMKMVTYWGKRSLPGLECYHPERKTLNPVKQKGMKMWCSVHQAQLLSNRISTTQDTMAYSAYPVFYFTSFCCSASFEQ